MARDLAASRPVTAGSRPDRTAATSAHPTISTPAPRKAITWLAAMLPQPTIATRI